ncbi:actin-related protein 6 [Backusella circina FSU 941]|nr:actin-related protein 6 [Backusella circina FSU 941]
MTPPTLILDNGASTIKVGIASNDVLPKCVPNAIYRGKHVKKSYIGDEIADCTDLSSLYYRIPFERGILTNWKLEKNIWDRVFQHTAQIEPSETRLLVTEPCFNLPQIQDSYDQIIFEEYNFSSCCRTIAPALCLFNEIGGLFNDKLGSIPDCTLIVDSGYSFTHIVPFLRGKPIAVGVKRLNVGGKLLTNHLKETVSFRSYDMMEETYIINDVKEKCCFMSKDVYKDLEICKKPGLKNTIVQDYVLPDFINTTQAQVKSRSSSANQHEQILTVNNERFMVPEILMHPSDIGMDQAGIPEAIIQSVHACDPDIHGLLYTNIILVGGNANIPGYMDRIKHDLRQFVPSEYEIRVVTPIDPVTFAWEGGQRFMASITKSELKDTFVERKEYLEFGSNICKRKFNTL